LPHFNRHRLQPPLAPWLTVSVEPLENALLVRAYGELDIGTVELLETRVNASLDSSSAVLLDLNGVRFIDSCGLRLLVRSSLRAGQLGRSFFIVRPSAQVSWMVDVTGTGAIVPLVSDEAGPEPLAASA
jgi:anti-sigma B factor antagonist